MRFLSIEWNSIRLGDPSHKIVSKTVHKTRWVLFVARVQWFWGINVWSLGGSGGCLGVIEVKGWGSMVVLV